MRRRSLLMVLLLGLLTSTAPVAVRGQDQSNNPDALKKQLADTLGQLKAAQDRKNELATENDKLKAQIVGMQKQIEGMQRESATWAEQTYEMRSRQAAWNAMLASDPNLEARWDLLLEASRADLPTDISRWKIVEPATVPATVPASVPATVPAATTSATTSTNPAQK